MKSYEELKLWPLALLGHLKLWNRKTLYTLYVGVIGGTGALLVMRGLFVTLDLLGYPSYDRVVSFLLLVLLALVAALVTSSAEVGDGGITYTVGPAIAIAAVPFFGPYAAAVIFAVHNVGMWLLKPANETTWKRSWSQLAFNIGMHSIAMLFASWLLLPLRSWLGGSTILGQTLPWVPAAYLFEELNFWILAGVLRLQLGDKVQPLVMWREDHWATQVGMLVTAIGGGTLAIAVQEYDWRGVIIFFMPIVLSAYAFRLYVRKMQVHLDNLESIVAQRTSALEELNHQKDAFLAVLTHDMITPLTSIQMYSELIQADPQIVLDNPRLIQIMLRSQKTVSDLVRDILDIERVASGGALLTQKVDCNLAQMIADAIEIVQPEAKEKGLYLHYKQPAHPLTIYADRHQIQRVLLNLLANAVKYTQPGGTITIELYQDGTYVFISFADTGYGIPADELPHIFNRFRRVGQHKDKAIGTGLGLTISKALVEEHRGEITVSSEVGQGSVFTVKVPIAADRNEISVDRNR